MVLKDRMLKHCREQKIRRIVLALWIKTRERRENFAIRSGEMKFPATSSISNVWALRGNAHLEKSCRNTILLPRLRSVPYNPPHFIRSYKSIFSLGLKGEIWGEFPGHGRERRGKRGVRWREREPGLLPARRGDAHLDPAGIFFAL